MYDIRSKILQHQEIQKAQIASGFSGIEKRTYTNNSENRRKQRVGGEYGKDSSQLRLQFQKREEQLNLRQKEQRVDFEKKVVGNEGIEMRNPKHFQQILDADKSLSISQRKFIQSIVSIAKKNNKISQKQYKNLQNYKAGRLGQIDFNSKN